MSKGKFVWFEFYANEIDGALAFYTEVVGWKTKSEQMPQGPYQLLLAGDSPIGGVMALPPEAKQAGVPPHWLGYIATDDVDQTVARAKLLGGSVVMDAFDVEGVGRIAILQDPQGAAFAAFCSSSAYEEHDRNADGIFGWSELATSDPAGAMKFYEELFGWKSTGSVEMGEAGAYDMFSHAGGEDSSGGIFSKPEQMPVSAWVYYSNVDDLDAAIARVNRAGGELLHGPSDVEGGRIAQFQDPQGGVFALHQYV